MIIWDEKEPWRPGSKDKCVMCEGQLQPPLVMWDPLHNSDEHDGNVRYFCGECCEQMRREFSNDMKQIATAKKVERLGFHRAGRQAAVSGGFLYTTGTDNKQ
jgi:hypothetical protein